MGLELGADDYLTKPVRSPGVARSHRGIAPACAGERGCAPVAHRRREWKFRPRRGAPGQPSLNP